MWVDYLIATLVGCLGIWGLLQWATDIIALNTLAHELTLAGWIIEDVSALLNLTSIRTHSLSDLCVPLPAVIRDTHCPLLSDWLARLSESRIDLVAGDSVRLQWRDAAGVESVLVTQRPTS